MHDSIIIQRALLTVSDKTNIVELAKSLHQLGVELISTGNTAAVLKENGIPVTTVGEYTGFPEIMQGRVKTLHPKIHGGILGRRDVDAETMVNHDIQDIDLIVVNLYPFAKVSQNPDASLEEVIENIDIGGPTLIRAAAKNYEWCTVVVDPQDYAPFITELQQHQGAVKEQMRFQLAAKAFTHTAAYETNIADFFGQLASENNAALPEHLALHYSLKERLRYGENPHQIAAFYQEPHPAPDTIAAAQQRQGKALSYNNIADADTALECVKSFAEPACVIVKHANPCGVAVSTTLSLAYEKAYACDSTAAFGGVIAFNREVDEILMTYILQNQFVEVLIAPGFTAGALHSAQQKQNCRLLQYTAQPHASTPASMVIKSVGGGILLQSQDANNILTIEKNIVTQRVPTPEEMDNLLFSWQVVKHVKSNAIVFAKDGQTLGIGTGQMSRIFSTTIAAMKAQEMQLSLVGAVMASDAFFPFQDNVEKAHEYGITAIIQPGGSKRDDEVIARANALGIAMVFTGIRCFRH